jgi:signal transduction histidine kinase
MKEMQARLGVAERMASLGTLAGGAAHEIMNPLAYATSNASFVADQLAQLEGSSSLASDLRQALGDALSGLERIRRVVENLRAFSHGDHALGPADLRQSVELAIQMAASEIRDRARLTRDFRPVFPVEGDVSRLGQVFLNLLVNAAQSISPGHPDGNEILIVMRMRDAAHALVEIHDTGCGIPFEIRNRVFDPFFTTRPIGRGMGLGLSVCHGIVRALGGDIDFESEVGRGTTFRVVLRATRSLSQEDGGETP